MGSLWVVVGRCGIVVGRCGIVVGRCGSLWIVVGRCGSFRVLVTTELNSIELIPIMTLCNSVDGLVLSASLSSVPVLLPCSPFVLLVSVFLLEGSKRLEKAARSGSLVISDFRNPLGKDFALRWLSNSGKSEARLTLSCLTHFSTAW